MYELNELKGSRERDVRDVCESLGLGLRHARRPGACNVSALQKNREDYADGIAQGATHPSPPLPARARAK